MKTRENLEKRGTAQAALLSSMIGILTLAVVNLATEISEEAKASVHQIGKLWMPGAEGIGPYSGKETIMLVMWLASWLLLNRWIRAKEWDSRTVITVFLAGIASATTLLWPPVFSAFTPH